MLQGLPHPHRTPSLTGRRTCAALPKAFKAGKRNRGAAGLDKPSIKMVEANVAENLVALRRELKSGTSQPLPLRRVVLPKGRGGAGPWASLPGGVAWRRKGSVP
jgi:retron-type reverse transcriptase